jgi:FixJ family two-component response regulator
MATIPHALSEHSLEKLVDIPYDHRVYIVDDDDGFRNSIVRLLQCCGVAAVGYRCAGEYLLGNHPDCASCIVLDMCMPGPSGLELFDSLATRANSPPVIFVTAFSDVPATVHAIKAGAIDFLTKPVDSKRLLRATRAALALDAHRRSARSEVQQLRERFAQLTECERDVFIGVVNGKLNKQLAVTLNICERSVKTYRSRVMHKMCVSSLAALVRSANVLNIAACSPPEVPQRLNSPHIERRHAESPARRFPMY